jgi:nanoRNase/pAp phosphatase (c-di-AMP/oligoRNAs hydrolase)
MEVLMEDIRTMDTEEILALPDVVERIEIYREQDAKFKEMVKAHTRVEGDVIISDLRGVDPIYSGNRFMIYSMYPDQNISAWIVNGRGGHGCSAAVGYSILNKTSRVNVGHLMFKYNGGGHEKVGTCQFSDDNMDTELPKMLKELCDLANN